MLGNLCQALCSGPVTECHSCPQVTLSVAVGSLLVRGVLSLTCLTATLCSLWEQGVQLISIGHIGLQGGIDSERFQHLRCLVDIALGQEWPRSRFSFPLALRT